MSSSIRELIEKVTNASNDFEIDRSELKRKYFIRNIYAFSYLVSLIDGNKGSFGTGYPFYVLEEDLTGEFPVIEEQIRYNNELLEHTKKTSRSDWTCKECLTKNYNDMPDLKQVCKPCPNMDNELKPRKIINRLPDIDMWMVCEDSHVETAQKELTELLAKHGIRTSDVDPIQTIKDMEEIAEDIKNGNMPKKFLPIDAHIIKHSKIKKLIQQVPGALDQAREKGQIPYLPIHPKSYRKKWQYDDEAYNFIYDFLSAFTQFNFTGALEQLLTTTRGTVIEKYSPEELYDFLLQSASEPNKRRNQTKELSEAFYRKIESWKKKKGEIDPWER